MPNLLCPVGIVASQAYFSQPRDRRLSSRSFRLRRTRYRSFSTASSPKPPPPSPAVFSPWPGAHPLSHLGQGGALGRVQRAVDPFKKSGGETDAYSQSVAGEDSLGEFQGSAAWAREDSGGKSSSRTGMRRHSAGPLREKVMGRVPRGLGGMFFAVHDALLAQNGRRDILRFVLIHFSTF